MRLDLYRADCFSRGAPRWKEMLWLLLNGLLLSSWIPGSGWRVRLLRLFGADIGVGVVIKPGVQVKFPWRLRIGSHCWVGERAWIDNLAEVRLGDHVCVSQDVYLCTGNHDWSAETFDLRTAPIRLEDHSWVCARATLAPGTWLEPGAILGLGSIGQGRIAAWTIHAGSPARPIGARPSPATLR